MKPALVSLSIASAALAAPSTRSLPVNHNAHHLMTRNSSTAGTKVILDNDWSTAGFVPILMALDAGWDVLGLVGDTANSWALQTSLHGLATLEVGNLSSCIPVYKGADYPLINTPALFQTWEDLHGDLAWVSRNARCFFSRYFPLKEQTSDIDNRKALLLSRTRRSRRWGMIRRLVTRRRSSRPPSTRASPTPRSRATTPRPG